MPFIRTISRKEATGRVKEIYDEWGVWATQPPSYIFSIRLDLLEDHVTYSGPAHFLAPSPLPPRLRQIVAVVVSKANSCPFCFESHSLMLQALGFSRSRYQKLIRETEIADMDNPTRVVSEFALKATVNVQEVTDLDIEKLRGALGDEGNSVEAVWTVAFFNFINRVVNSLGVTLDFPSRFFSFAFKSVKSSFSIGLGRVNPITKVMVKMSLTPRPEKFSRVDAEEVLYEVQTMYRERLGFTQAPPFYKALAARPIQMKAWANKARVLLEDGMLPLETKMMIASLTARIDGYDWLLQESKRWLKTEGTHIAVTDPLELASDTQLDPGLRKILLLTHDISLQSYKITQRRIDELRNEGLGDEEVLEAVSVASFFNGESRLDRCLA